MFLGTSVRETEADLEDFAEQKVRLPLAFRKAVQSKEGERERERGRIGIRSFENIRMAVISSRRT